MKKYFLFACVAAALVSCSSDDFLGENEGLTQNADGTIVFTAGSQKTQRALVGSAAAEKLNNTFVVYGTKHSAAEDKTATNDALVFNNYQVTYGANTAGTTTDNTNNWAYVGKTAYTAITGDQTIKYWDYAAAEGYTFYAFSAKPGTSGDISFPANTASDKVQVTKVKGNSGDGNTVYDKGYTLTVKNGASLDDIYFSDRVEVAKGDYNKPVVFTFRKLASKVRVGFYETVPGYSVKIDKFYFDNDASAAVTTYAAMEQTSNTDFKAALQNVMTDATSNAVTVSYYDDTKTSIENRVKVTNTTVGYNYTLTLGNQIAAATRLGTSAAEPTWDQANGDYTTVYPYEGNTNPLLLRVDYTLTSTDGSGEKIVVKNARAIVPTQYVQWKSNTAYTYLFKISSNTNGTTGTTPADPDNPGPDPEGLFPITFDAYVAAVEDGNTQETITTIATNTVTTYSADGITNEYVKGQPIYVVATDNNAKTLITPSAIGDEATKAQVYKLTGLDNASEADVLGKLTGLASSLTMTATTGDEAATLVSEVPATDGTKYVFGDATNKGAVKFTPSTAGKYAYVYTTTKYVAPTPTAVGTDAFSSTTDYYAKNTVNGVDYYSAVSGLNEDNFDANKANLYTLSGGTAGNYTVKVINVTENAVAAALTASNTTANTDESVTLTFKQYGAQKNGGDATVKKMGTSDWETATADTDYTLVNNNDGTYIFTGKIAGKFQITIGGKSIEITVTSSTPSNRR